MTLTHTHEHTLCIYAPANGSPCENWVFISDYQNIGQKKKLQDIFKMAKFKNSITAAAIISTTTTFNSIIKIYAFTQTL